MTNNPMNTRTLLLIAGALALVIAAGLFLLTPSPDTATDSKTQVTVSFYPMAYLAERIGGEYVTVTNLTPAGSEPHSFEPSARDLAKIQDADLLILNGTVEAWGDRVIAQLAGSGVAVLIAADGLMTKEGMDAHAEEEGHGEVHEEEHASADPHIWLDPVLYAEQAARVSEALVLADPANAAAYEANYAALAADLAALDTEFKTGLSVCKGNSIVTTHTAFSYLAERYGLKQVAINGLSSEAEPTPSALAEVATFARSNGVTHIFFETLVSPKLAQTVASEIGAQTLVLDPLEGLSREDSASGKDYLSVMRENLANLRTALSCE